MAGQHTIHLTVNGRPVEATVPGYMTLLDFLREELGLTGIKEGCSQGDCGACTVLLDGLAVNACLVLAVQADGHEVLTIEGLGGRERPHPLQQAFVACGAVQCGYCTPGMLLSAKALLDHNPAPSREEIRRAIAGNLCRCTGYQKVIQAIEAVAQQLTEGVDA